MRLPWTRDEIILACELVRENGWKALDARHPKVQELSRLLRSSPLHALEERDDNFRSPDSVGRKTSDIATRHPDYHGKRTKGNSLDPIVLSEFLDHPEQMSHIARQIRAVLTSGAVDVASVVAAEHEVEDFEVSEGRLLLARHLKRERNKKLRDRKIRAVRRTNASLACEVCGFDFAVAYGPRGEGYIEVHHIQPLHAVGETVTRLDDLVLLCANCHRMIHRRDPWLTPDSLSRMMPVSRAAVVSLWSANRNKAPS